MKIVSNYHDLFSTRIWTFDLVQLAVHFPSWVAAIEALRNESPKAAGRSIRHGWNSDKLLFASPAFAYMRGAAERAFAFAFTQMGLSADFRFHLEAWANVHDTGAYNTAHLHHQVLLSGCFYLATPEGSGAIVFRDPRPAVGLSPFHKAGANNFQPVSAQPKAGSLLLFPNWLEHEVKTHEGTSPRISIGINALPA